MIFGEQKVQVVTFMPNEGLATCYAHFKRYPSLIRRWRRNSCPCRPLVWVTINQASRIKEESDRKMVIVTGLNAEMLIHTERIVAPDAGEEIVANIYKENKRRR